jgi:hypothetical protein
MGNTGSLFFQHGDTENTEKTVKRSGVGRRETGKEKKAAGSQTTGCG